jgi:Na+-driven multidrug efflux pump
VLNNQLRFQGGAMYSMVGITIGAVLNIILDPLLILPQFLNLGVAGAGWATSISQTVSFCILLIGCNKGSNIHIRLTSFRLKWHYYHMIFRGGLPSLARQCLSSLAAISLNHSIAAVLSGVQCDAAIAAMGVVQRIAMFFASVMLGFGQGFQPVCGFNYGAGFYDRVKKGFWFCVKVSACVLVAIGTFGFLFAPDLIGLFRDDPLVISYGARALRFQCVTFPVQSWIVMSTMMQQSTNRTVSATFLSVARQGLFFIPLVLILSAVLGILGVQMAQSCADILTLFCAIPIQIHVLNNMKKN